MRNKAWLCGLLLPAALAVGCSDDGPHGGGPGGPGGPGRGGGMGGMNPEARGAAAVPVEVATVERRVISSYIETNGTLEAENEVDIVARVTAPIVELFVEEGDAVRLGQPIARLDDTEFRAQLEIARVAVEETRQIYERSETLFDQKLVSPEAYELAFSALEGARAQFEANRILVGYTEIAAPLAGLIVTRYVDAAEQVQSGQALYRISDFDPLLCPIQVPERDLSRLRIGQQAWLRVESWPGERFPASVLRISPVVDAATGTIKVTLVATSPERLRPGMFARVFLEAERKPNALVVPKAALSLESIGDTVYVADGGAASRREVTLGFQEGDRIEVVTGVAEGEAVIVVGQDGLSDGTPVQVLGAMSPPSAPATVGGPPAAPPGPGPGGPPRGKDGRPDFSQMTPEQIEQMKERMRSRGLTEEEIEERLERARERAKQDSE